MGGSQPGRFIPTHVGNTARPPPGSPTATVHPHTRGEHTCLCGGVRLPFGSSPHTWGTPPCSTRRREIKRFIPTHVGNTHYSTFSVSSLTVHPHTRGEHVLERERERAFNTVHPHTRGEHESAPEFPVTGLGSSPHTWGTLDRADYLHLRGRFIPTHVGNTLDLRVTDFLMPVHPHTRGEHPHSP